MIKDLGDIILSNNKQKLLRAFDIVLWVSLVFVTFNYWVISISPIPLKEIDQIYLFILSASYLTFIQWCFIILVIYFVLKFTLLKLFPYSNHIYNYFLKKSLNAEAFIAILNLQYKKSKAQSKHKKNAHKVIQSISKERNEEIVKNAKLIMDILLKVLLLGIIELGYGNLPIQWLPIMSIILVLLAMVIIEISIIKAKSQNKLHQFISALS